MIFLSIIFVVLVTIIRFKMVEKLKLLYSTEEFLVFFTWTLSIIFGIIFFIVFWEASPILLLLVNKEHITGITGWIKGFLRRKIMEFISEDEKEPEPCERNSYCTLCGNYIVENKSGKNYTKCEKCRSDFKR